MTITITGSSKECVAEAEVREFLFTFTGLVDLRLHFLPSFTLCVYGIVLVCVLGGVKFSVLVFNFVVQVLT